MNEQERNSILKQAKIDQSIFDELGLKWSDLELILADYNQIVPALTKAGEYIANDLMNARNVHSVRFRAKSPLHLITKIVRKRIQNQDRIIDLSTYKKEITDLIGVRAIHLLKNQWVPINKFIRDKWDLHEQPIAYIRSGDSSSYLDQFKKDDFIIKEHDFGYRSLHYIIPTKPAKDTYFVEIQVRTIFEEGWSEIDHKVRYPNTTDNALFNEFLLILNRLAGSADEMGAFIINLRQELSQQRMEFNDALWEKDQKIKELESKINGLDINKEEKADMVGMLNSINRVKLNHFTELLRTPLDGTSYSPLAGVASSMIAKAFPEGANTEGIKAALNNMTKQLKKNNDK